MKTDEKGWLIERVDGGRHEWWTGRGEGRAALTAFNHEHGQAVRFARFEDAEVVRCWLLGSLRGLTSTLHMWAQSPSAREAGCVSADPTQPDGEIKSEQPVDSLRALVEKLTTLEAKWRSSANKVAPIRGVPLFERDERKYNTLMDCADELESALSVLKGQPREQEEQDDTQIGRSR